MKKFILFIVTGWIVFTAESSMQFQNYLNGLKNTASWNISTTTTAYRIQYTIVYWQS